MTLLLIAQYFLHVQNGCKAQSGWGYLFVLAAESCGCSAGMDGFEHAWY